MLVRVSLSTSGATSAVGDTTTLDSILEVVLDGKVESN